MFKVNNKHTRTTPTGSENSHKNQVQLAFMQEDSCFSLFKIEMNWKDFEIEKTFHFIFHLNITIVIFLVYG